MSAPPAHQNQQVREELHNLPYHEAIEHVYDDPDFVYEQLKQSKDFASLVNELKKFIEKEVIEKELLNVLQSDKAVQAAIYGNVDSYKRDDVRKMIDPLLAQTGSTVRRKAAEACWQQMTDGGTDIGRSLHEQVAEVVHRRVREHCGVAAAARPPQDVPPEADAALAATMVRQPDSSTLAAAAAPARHGSQELQY